MKIFFLTVLVPYFLLSLVSLLFADPEGPFVMTIDSTKGAKINVYCYESSSDNIQSKPLLLVHGFNSSGSVWRDRKSNYVDELTNNGYDVIVVDMRGNLVDSNGDHKIDAPVVGDSWGYGIRDLGDDVGTALVYGINYLNKNLPDRNYEKADVITHSTGALAVTGYSRSLGLVPYRNNIDTIIELAPPNNGSTNLIANIKKTAQIIPSVFTQSVIAYEYALELSGEKIWIPGGRMESENLRKELTPESLFLKSIAGLGPAPDIKTFIAIGAEDWVVGDWSPIIEDRKDIGYEYFLGLDHFEFCNSELVIKCLLDKLEKRDKSSFFARYKPYRNKMLLSFLSGPGLDHPDDTFDVVSFAKNIDISPGRLFDLYLRIAGRKNKASLVKYWEAMMQFEKALIEFDNEAIDVLSFDKWEALLADSNRSLHCEFKNASQEYLECPDIAVLANGYYNELVKLIIEKTGEPVRTIDQSFSPSIINEQKILLIPSGGLAGLSSSEIFKRKLLEFVKHGGTLICLSQQHGYDFRALPTSCVYGYGWQEDSSCHYRAAYIENFHQILASQTELYPDFKLDGYFTAYPENSEVILRRTKNLMPAILIYNFEKGKVVVASIYTDWGYVNGQASKSEINLIRDVIRWSKKSEVLPEYKSGESLQKTIDIAGEFNEIEMVLKAPDNSLIEKKILNNSTYELTAVLNEPGIYCVDYILCNAEHEVIQPQTEGFYFCYSLPPEGSVENPDFSFNITTDKENYIQGAEALFSFHLYNNTSRSETLKCKAKFNHQEIQFTESVDIPPKTSASFDKKIIITQTDMVIADFYSSGNSFLGKAERGVNVHQPLVKTEVMTDKKQYAPGQKIEIEGLAENTSQADIDLLLVLNVIDAANNEIYYSTKNILLGEGKDDLWRHEFEIPRDSARGRYNIELNAFFSNRLIGSCNINVDIPAPLVFDSDNLTGTNCDLLTLYMDKFVYKPGEPITAKVIIDNKDNKVDRALLNIKVLPNIDKGELCGTIMRIDDEPIRGASVNDVYTNNNGRYKIGDIGIGDHVLNVKAAGYNREAKHINILGGDNNIDVSLNATKYGNVSGILKDFIGSELRLEPIDVKASDLCSRYAVVSTQGTVDFKHVPVGKYILYMQPEDIERNIEVLEGENIVLGQGSFNLNPEEQDIFDIQQDLEQDIYESEPNNNFMLADEISPGSNIHGEIYDYGDEDYFKLNVNSPSIMNISVENLSQGLCPYIRIYDSKEKLLDSTAASAGQGIGHSLEISEPGIYYLNLKDRYNTCSAQEGYNLRIDVISGLDKYEPNADFNTAKEIKVRGRICPTMFPTGDEDWFSFNAKERGLFYIEMQDVEDGFRPSLKLYDSSCKLLAQKGGTSGEQITLESEIKDPGEYYILTRDWYSNFSSLKPYSFKFYFIKTEDEYEPNNTIGQATPLEFGRSYFSTIATKGDLDFYKLSIPDAGKVIIYLNDVPENIRPYIKLYRENNAQWIDSSAGSAGSSLTMELETDSPGNSYIQVQDRYNSESSVLRYRLLGLYIPKDEYILNDKTLFNKDLEVSDLGDKKEIDIIIPGFSETEKYYLQIALKSLLSLETTQVVEAFHVGDSDVLIGHEPMAEIIVSCLTEENMEFNAGDKVYFRFKAFNKGDAGGICRIDFKFMDLFEQSLSEFLDPDSEKILQFEFQIPIDLEEGLYKAEYIVQGERHMVDFKILGINLDVDASYVDNIFKIKVHNNSSVSDITLLTEARCGNFEEVKDFVLTDSEELIFYIPEVKDEKKIYYGIYFVSGKAIYLNSYLLNSEEKTHPIAFKVTKASCDKDSYENGNIIFLGWRVNSMDAINVRLIGDLVYPDSNAINIIDEEINFISGINDISKDIRPALEPPGLYRILYRFIYEEAVTVEGSVFFDVGKETRIDLEIDKKEYIENETVEIQICCFSSTKLTGDLVMFLDDLEIKRSGGVNLDGYQEFKFSVKPETIGQHCVYCSLFYGNAEFTSNKQIFNISAKPRPNCSPVLFSIGEKRIVAGDILEFFIEAIDIDGDKLLYYADNLPEGASFDFETRRFLWKTGHEQAGEYYPTFTVSDGKDTVSERVKIVVDESMPPSPIIEALALPQKGTAPLEVHFSVTGVDKKDSIVKYEWDFDGRGIYDISSLVSGEADFIYASKGSYPAVLRLTDDKGNTHTYSVAIEVERNPNAPLVYLEVVPLKGLAPCKVYFKGTTVSLSDICKYEWDFNGDGVYDTSSTESAEVVKTYSLPGVYNAGFRVTDKNGISESESVTITIDNPLSLNNIEPLISVYNGNIPMEVNFNASVDAQSNIQKYQWDFEGDGIFDFISQDTAVVSYVYCKPGSYAPTLRITDEKNISAQCTREISLGITHSDWLKKGKLKIDSKKGKAPFTAKFFFDAEFATEEAEYYWDFDGDGRCDLVTFLPEAEYTYYDPGVYLAEVNIETGDDYFKGYKEAIYITNKEEKIQRYEEIKNFGIKEELVKGKKYKIELSDRTCINLPADILNMDDILSVVKLDDKELSKEMAFGNDITPIGEYREYYLEKHKDSFSKEITISIPYPDEDRDGFVDNRNIDESTLDVYWFDESCGEWKLLSDGLIFPKENLVIVKTNHFSIFGIAGRMKAMEDIDEPDNAVEIDPEGNGSIGVGADGGNGTTCFIATAAFGTPMADEVKILCDLRDKYLIRSRLGRILINFYYSYSPPVASFIKQSPLLRAFLRYHLKFLVKLASVVL